MPRETDLRIFTLFLTHPLPLPISLCNCVKQSWFALLLQAYPDMLLTYLGKKFGEETDVQPENVKAGNRVYMLVAETLKKHKSLQRYSYLWFSSCSLISAFKEKSWLGTVIDLDFRLSKYWFLILLYFYLRFALKQERFDNLGQWKHNDSTNPEWNKQALSWPVRADGSLNEVSTGYIHV